MTKQEAIDRVKGFTFMDHSNYEANNMALQALRNSIDPEWIPNTGTKPECEYAWCRYPDGYKSLRLVSNVNWSIELEAAAITHYIPIPAPPEFVKKRRYVVVEGEGDKYLVEDTTRGYRFVAYGIDTKQAAQSIADIYERMNEETK